MGDGYSTVRPLKLFFYYDISPRSEQTEEDGTGRTVGGDTIFGRLALIRSKLNLTENELMEKSWIALNLELIDFPYYDMKAKDRPKVNDMSFLDNRIGMK